MKIKNNKVSPIKKIAKQQQKSALVNITPLVVCSLLGLALFVSITFTLSERSPLYNSLSKLQKYPAESIAHADLARLYILSNNLELAQTELQLASTSLSNNQVLGESSDITELKRLLLEKPQRLQKTKAYWENVVSHYPLYRDAWIQLLYIARNSQDDFGVTKYKGEINQLDPNYDIEKSLGLE